MDHGGVKDGGHVEAVSGEGRKGLGYRWMSGGRQGIKEGRWSQGGAGQGTGGGVKVKTAV